MGEERPPHLDAEGVIGITDQDDLGTVKQGALGRACGHARQIQGAADRQQLQRARAGDLDREFTVRKHCQAVRGVGTRFGKGRDDACLIRLSGVQQPFVGAKAKGRASVFGRPLADLAGQGQAKGR